MPRARSGPASKHRHDKILQLAKGFRYPRGKTFRRAHEAVMHSLQYAYRDRRTRKRDFRSLWIIRINAAAREHGLSYSTFMNGLRKAQVDVDRKMLAEMAVNNQAAFAELAALAKRQLSVAV